MGNGSKQAITAASVVASGGLAALKLLVGGLSGSLGLLAEAAHSLLDLFSSLITLLVVRVAAVPPDSNHPYGHERAEQLGALAGMTLLAGTGALILYHAFDTILFHPGSPAVSVWAFAVLIVSVIVDFFRARALRRAAASHASSALASDAEHFANDMLGAISVLVGLAIIALRDPLHLPLWLVARADAFAALIVAVIAFRSVWNLGSKAVHALMDDVPIGLTERLKVEPRPIRRLKVNGSPLLYPLWDIERRLFGETSEEDLMRTASLVRADPEFMEKLTHAAASAERVYPPSEHVEQQIYGAGFFSDSDRDLCSQFHSRRWEERLRLVERFDDQRLRRLGRRLIYFEAPHLIDETERRAMDEDIAARRRGDGRHSSPQWTTVPGALSELESIGAEISQEFRRSFAAIT